jgi:hypothetical protein
MSANVSKQVGQWMEERAQQLGLQWTEIAVRTGLTEEGIRKIRDGRTERPNRATRALLEEALRWMPGSFDSIRAGGEPANLPEPLPAEDADTTGFEAAPDAQSGEDEGLFDVVALWIERLRAVHGDRVARVYIDGLFAQPAEPRSVPEWRSSNSRVTG